MEVGKTKCIGYQHVIIIYVLLRNFNNQGIPCIIQSSWMTMTL